MASPLPTLLAAIGDDTKLVLQNDSQVKSLTEYAINKTIKR